MPGAPYPPSINSFAVDSTAFSPTATAVSLQRAVLLLLPSRNISLLQHSQLLRRQGQPRTLFLNAIPIVAGRRVQLIALAHTHTQHLLRSYPCLTPLDAIFAATLGTTTFRLILFLQHHLLESGVWSQINLPADQIRPQALSALLCRTAAASRRVTLTPGGRRTGQLYRQQVISALF